ncbi:MDR family oxidoreductase [Arenibaculum pallidiluteum]|uniref:MDR family oxidoreductase n=1 Tax=Arenibaculum pallidiluteum TaxID=2812559 RepID=UPI001A96A50A|nr:MDR family oxidoreductase [Arenibaculum pallidiluteum]
MVRALVLDEADGKVSASVQEVAEDRLPEGDVTIAVEWSTLNYKDGMIVKGLGRLVRSYPHVPGVDLAGRVIESRHPDWQPGDAVVLTGWRVGELRWGGYAARARVRGEWLVPLPAGLTSRQAMAVGTAGFTAMLAIMELERRGLTPEAGEVLVTGAAGGVGSIATALLSRLGYAVAASTGRAEQHDYLRRLGARTIIERAEIAEPSRKPLESERWAACIDAVGGAMLARVLGQLRHGGALAAVGNAGGVSFEASVLPFLLRGVAVLGIDSVVRPIPDRLEAWRRIAASLPLDLLDSLTEEAGLGDLDRLAGEILKGRVRGRVVIDPQR